MREWLSEDDLVFVVLDAVAALDLGAFRRRYRADGHGRAAYDPEMMVALLLYAYCQGVRSSRVIEQRCLRDVGYRVIVGGSYPRRLPKRMATRRHRAQPAQAAHPAAEGITTRQPNGQDTAPAIKTPRRLSPQPINRIAQSGHGALDRKINANPLRDRLSYSSVPDVTNIGHAATRTSPVAGPF